ncbi:MAG: Gfo/Idh/MocA family oxidoreductase [Bryobacterales bacterium]|nr:Gfo/Idh/MocA family oxidoreductase [Bryobacterales bacterium]
MAMETSKPVRLLMAGAGLMGQAHIDRIQREPDAQLAGIVDVTPEAAAKAAQLGVPFGGDLGEMIEQTQPDGVVIALPNQAHYEAGMIALHAGVAVLMEKPVCDTVEQALDLARASEEHGVAVLVGHHRRHSLTLGRAREIIASGRLGTLTAVNAMCWLLKPAAYFEGRNQWRRQTGGGPVLINLIHAIDDLRNLCGEIGSVQAMTSNAARGFDVEDTAGVVLGFANGAIGTVTLSDAAAGPWSWELTSGENRGYPRTEESCYFVAGTRGALSVPRLEFWQHGAGGDWWSPLQNERRREPETEADPLARQLRHFIDVARGKAHPVLDARGAAETLRATLAVLRSAAEGRRIAW